MLTSVQKALQQEGFVVLTIRVRPNAPVTRIADVLSDESLKIDLHAPADEGKANAELARFLAKECGVKPADVQILSGAASRKKLVRITASRG